MQGKFGPTSAYASGGAKRLFDVMLALPLSCLALPVALLAAVAIRLETPGSPLLAQTRVCRQGRSFTCYKLRTMTSGTVAVPTHEAQATAITRVGRFLRASKLDELPQLLNVLRGEMSLVGPRPCLPVQAELVTLRRQVGVLEVRPGVTGLAQVRGIDMSDPRRLAKVDAEYVATASFSGDLILLLRTVLPAIRG